MDGINLSAMRVAGKYFADSGKKSSVYSLGELLPKAVNAYRHLPELYEKMREDLKATRRGFHD